MKHARAALVYFLVSCVCPTCIFPSTGPPDPRQYSKVSDSPSLRRPTLQKKRVLSESEDFKTCQRHCSYTKILFSRVKGYCTATLESENCKSSQAQFEKYSKYCQKCLLNYLQKMQGGELEKDFFGSAPLSTFQKKYEFYQNVANQLVKNKIKLDELVKYLTYLLKRNKDGLELLG